MKGFKVYQTICKRIADIDAEIRYLKNKQRSLRLELGKSPGGPSNTKSVVLTEGSGSDESCDKENVLNKWLECQERINELILEKSKYEEDRETIKNGLYRFDDVKFRIAQLTVIEGYNDLKQVAKELGYSYGYIRNMNSEILEEFEELKDVTNK